MRIRLIAVMLSCLLSASALPLAPARAAEPQVMKIHTAQLVGANTALAGAVSARAFAFWLETYWQPDEVRIQLDYQATPLAVREHSSVTLSVNGTKFHSFRPVIQATGTTRLSVAVPLNLLTPGSNTVTVTGYLQTAIDDKFCQTLERSNNWLQLYDTSEVSLRYTAEPFEGSIRDFSRRFGGLDTPANGGCAVEVPEASGADELTAAAYALTGFARSSRLADMPIPLTYAGRPRRSGNAPVTLVGLYDNLPDAVKSLVDDTGLDQAAVLQVTESGGRPLLVVTSRNPALLVKAGKLAANPVLLQQIDSAGSRVDDTTEVDTPAAGLPEGIRLTDTGDKLTGMQHQEKAYFVALPVNRAVAGSSVVHLDFRYARNLDFERSLVTVLVNDKPIGSKKLTRELADGDTLALTIPANVQVSGSFSVTVAFDLELTHGSCMEPDQLTPWAFITPDSFLRLQTKDRTALTLGNFPYPFIRDGGFNRVAVALPQARDDQTLLAISNLFNLLGRNAEGNRGELQFYEENVEAGVRDELMGRNIIAIGGYTDNSVLREANDKLYFRYSGDGAGFLSNEKITLNPEYAKRIGTLQLLDSPFEAGRSLLAVTGPGSEYSCLASKLIATEEAKWRIYGDGVITDKDGEIRPYRFQAEAAPADNPADRLLGRSDLIGFLAAAISIAVLVLVSLLLLVRKYRRKRRSEP